MIGQQKRAITADTETPTIIAISIMMKVNQKSITSNLSLKMWNNRDHWREDRDCVTSGLNMCINTIPPIIQALYLQVNKKSCRLRMGAYRDGVKRKGDKIGMGV